MRAESVLIVASPYEAELLSRALADTGLRLLRADGGDGALALLATELPIAIVVGTSLFGVDPSALIGEARSRHPRVTLFLLADPVDPLAEAMRPRVTEIFRRPTDFDALAQAIEKVAVSVESEDLLEVSEVLPLAPPPPPLPRIRTDPMAEIVAELPLIRAQRTEILSDVVGTAVALDASPLLRADELGSVPMDDIVPASPAPPARRRAPFEARSTIARELDRELSQAERRLFPDAGGSGSSFGADEHDEALSDIDLDTLGIDTAPGLALGLELDGSSSRARARAVEAAQPVPPQRPVQEEGSLAEIDIAELLARLHGNAFTGALHVARPEGLKVLYLDQGEPVGARSTLRHDDLAELLFRDGKLTREQVAQARAGARAASPSSEGAARPVALRLLELGLLKESETFAAARRHAEELLFSLFAVESGRYHLGPDLPSAEERVRLPSSMWALLFEGVRRKYGLERLLARLGGASVVLRPTTLFARVVEAAVLSAEERRIAALIDGARSLSEVRASVGGRVGQSTLYATAFALKVCGAVEAGSGPADVQAASTVTSNGHEERRARPRAVDAEQLAAEQAVDRERIEAKRAQIADADYFTVLGVTREATDHELRRAHTRQRADFDPTRFSDETASANRDVLIEIQQVLDEALRVLLAPGVRARYVAHLDPLDGGQDGA